jgi:hypothetical protein
MAYKEDGAENLGKKFDFPILNMFIVNELIFPLNLINVFIMDQLHVASVKIWNPNL